MAPRFWSVGLVVPFVEMGTTKGEAIGGGGRTENEVFCFGSIWLSCYQDSVLSPMKWR